VNPRCAGSARPVRSGFRGISRARAYRLMADRSPEQFLADLDAIKIGR
jgi:hypothetical protein